jgi:hypothetical protein
LPVIGEETMRRARINLELRRFSGGDDTRATSIKANIGYSASRSRKIT